MASITKRRNRDGSTSWDAMVRIVGYPTASKSFRTKLAAELWASTTQVRAKGGTLACSRGMTLALLLDEALPRLRNPTGAAFAYWREHLGHMRLDKITPELIALHRDRLIGGECRGHGQSKDLYAFVLFALTTGARKGEIAALEWPHCDLARRWAIFGRTKNGEQRGVPLTVAVCELLAPRKQAVGHVFETDITRAWHTAIKRAAIANFRFHDLRHSCASTLVQNGANLAEVATLLGHKSLQMTLRYSHISHAGTSSLVDRVMGHIA